MAIDPKRTNVDLHQSEDERVDLIHELEELAPEGIDQPPAEHGGSDKTFTALQAQGLGSGALGTDPYTQKP